jgi:hypothetical protein
VVLSAAALPLVIVSVLTAVLMMSVSRSRLGQASGLVLAAALVGLLAVGIVQGWLGALDGSWVVNAGVLSLMVLAIGATAAGLMALLGRAGLAVAAPLMVLIGNPFSGVSSAPELLPRPVGLLGQLLPPGRAASCCAARRSSTAPAPPGTWRCWSPGRCWDWRRWRPARCGTASPPHRSGTRSPKRMLRRSSR